MKTVRVLQLGEQDLSTLMPVSSCAQWHYEPDISEPPGKDFDLAILDREITEDELAYLLRFLRAYTLFVTENVSLKKGSPAFWLMLRKMGKRILPEELETLLSQELQDYFPGSYGEKYAPKNLSVAQGFAGKVSWRGYEGVDLEGDFGNELTQVAFWRNSIPIEENQAIDFWLEYAKEGTVEIALEISLFNFSYGSVPQTIRTQTFSEKDMEDIVYVENTGKRSFLFASIQAKGTGKLTVCALHDRHSRRGKGMFLPGGKRCVTQEREEIFYYFDPGNLKPPLNVYFSGYKTREGFEGYKMLRRMGRPFLLIAEARLEGGAFYIGSEEYENALKRVIRSHMEILGFQNSEMIFSGLSMGTYGALYYGCLLRPHTILLGKPLASIGDVAQNERIARGGGFPTSLDMLHKFCGSLSSGAAEQLNDRFWNMFDQTEWGSTQFAVAYMIEDDYDSTAYEMLRSHLKGTRVRIYGKGLHGRHNDNTSGIVKWFVTQYNKIIEDHFDNAQGETGGRR